MPTPKHQLRADRIPAVYSTQLFASAPAWTWCGFDPGRDEQTVLCAMARDGGKSMTGCFAAFERMSAILKESGSKPRRVVIPTWLYERMRDVPGLFTEVRDTLWFEGTPIEVVEFPTLSKELSLKVCERLSQVAPPGSWTRERWNADL